MSLANYNPVLSVGVLVLPLLCVNLANAEQHLTYVQNNGSLDGYYVEDDQASSSLNDDATESETETAATSDETTSIETWTNAITNTVNTGTPVTTNTMDMTEQTTKTTVTGTPITTNTMDTAEKTTKTTATGTNNVATSTITASTCQAAWDQCGGLDYDGATCCEAGLTCVTMNSYWARCISQSTLSTESATASETGSSSSTNEYTTVGKSTIYSYELHSEEYKITSTDSAGHKYTIEVSSESTETIIESISDVIKSTNETNSGNAIAFTDKGSWKSKLMIGVILGLGVLAL